MKIKNTSVLITGAAGFIGSVMAGHLNQLGYANLVLVDDFGEEAKRANWETKQYAHVVERQSLQNWLTDWGNEIDVVIHLGARTDTTEFDYAVHQALNVEYSQMLWQFCTQRQIPFIYASSAATYGNGDLGYNDNHDLPFLLKPLNPYGISKNEFDKWALGQVAGEAAKDEPESASKLAPPFWAGLKFFNVYGPNEYHKGRMASVIWHAFNQINASGRVKLFRSHKAGFNDGEQLRDFVYVKDVAKVIFWFLSQIFQLEDANGQPDDQNPSTLANTMPPSGLYNLGTGQARSFFDLAAATFWGMGLETAVDFVDMPEDIREKYQYFTQANMQKLRLAGYHEPFYSLEDGVQDYVSNYLVPATYY
ncbi:MAG: ADP-glyceromanno-heptose 6-epimerase [Bacteroidetes bacterium]|nr:MAG: ADP-glyceromanno-heptose 6-epimerase [Bacteroidota bacterium]